MSDYKVNTFSYWKNTKTNRVAIVLNWDYQGGKIKSYEVLRYGDREVTQIPYDEFHRKIQEKEIIEI